MVDISSTIIAKSDQLNADDLIGGPITVTITNVSLTESPDQPLTINYDGDNGRPYKPCKSMRRVLAAAWGNDGSKFIGRRVTLFRDPRVKWAGQEVGGIPESQPRNAVEREWRGRQGSPDDQQRAWRRAPRPADAGRAAWPQHRGRGARDPGSGGQTREACGVGRRPGCHRPED